MLNYIDIDINDLNEVQRLHYEYNALLDLIPVLDIDSRVYQDILGKLIVTKREFEECKRQVIGKYLKDTETVGKYEFNFFNNRLYYERREENTNIDN